MKRTAEELEKRVGSVVDYCLENGVPPDSFCLREIGGISEEELDRVRVSKTAGQRAKEAVRRLDEFRTAFWLRQGLREPRLASFATFNLRQPRNGGFSDKSAGTSGAVEILVKTDGVGEGAFD